MEGGRKGKREGKRRGGGENMKLDNIKQCSVLYPRLRSCSQLHNTPQRDGIARKTCTLVSSPWKEKRRIYLSGSSLSLVSHWSRFTPQRTHSPTLECVINPCKHYTAFFQGLLFLFYTVFVEIKFTKHKNHHFKIILFRFFGIFVRLCNHHLVQNTSVIPKRNLAIFSSCSKFTPFPLPSNQ